MATGKTPESNGWILGMIPRQRPKKEWEHVHVTRNGGRYVNVEELFARESVKEDLAKMKELSEEVRRNRMTKNLSEGGLGS